MRENVHLQVHKLLIALYKAHLDVEGDVFIEVPRGLVFLSPVGGPYLEDPFHSRRNHSLLVELGRLGEVDAAVEIGDLE